MLNYLYTLYNFIVLSHFLAKLKQTQETRLYDLCYVDVILILFNFFSFLVKWVA